MSKSISGLGTTDLTINELRLLGATFTILNTSDLFVSGTAQIGNIVISGTFNVGQLTADAVTTPELIASGTISIKALFKAELTPEFSKLQQIYIIIHQPTN